MLSRAKNCTRQHRVLSCSLHVTLTQNEGIQTRHRRPLLVYCAARTQLT